jgi:hypothetical protein
VKPVFDAFDDSHGRLVRRRVFVCPEAARLEALQAWPGLHTVLAIETIRSVNGSGRIEAEVRYFLSSCSDDPAMLVTAIRRHWSIENNLHWVLEVVFTQLTKAGVFTLVASGQHVADLDVAIGDNHAVDEQQHELPALLEGGRGKPVLHARAEGLEGCGDAGELLLTRSVAAELLLLAGQGLDALLEIAPPPLILIERNNRSEIGVGEPFDLLVQARLATA